MASFCWGDRHQPTLDLDQTDTHVLVRLDGADRHIPKSKIVGWVQEGQRVQCLVSGGRWLWGTARDREGVLWVELDCGRSWVVSNARWLKVQQLSLFAAPIISSDHSDNSVNSNPLINGVGQKPIISSEDKARPTLYFDIPEGTRKVACKGCGAGIYWVKTPKGKAMPVDADGQAHWGTCAKAKDFGKAAKCKPSSKQVKKQEVERLCDFCSSPATLLCDGRIKVGCSYKTCDHPICRACAKQVGNIFGCNRQKPSLSFTDTVDWCPDCVAAHEKSLVDKLPAVYDADSPNCQQNQALASDLSTQLVPMPELEDYEEDEMALAQQYDLLEPLKTGDRIRIVLAGRPLEHLTGALGTVEGAETCELIPVLVDGFGSKFLRREQLDYAMDATETSLSNPRIEETFHSGQKVTHRSRWLGKSERSPVLAAT